MSNHSPLLKVSRIINKESMIDSLKIPAIMDTLASHMRSEHNAAFREKEKVEGIGKRMKDHCRPHKLHAAGA